MTLETCFFLNFDFSCFFFFFLLQVIYTRGGEKPKQLIRELSDGKERSITREKKVQERKRV